MKIVVRPLFLKRSNTEAWLTRMAEKGYLLQDVSMMIFQGFGAFRFEKQTPCKVRYALYEQKLSEDHEIWLETGWTLVCMHDGFSVYQTTDKTCSYPLLKLPTRFLHRLVKSLLNISFVLWLLFILRMDVEAVSFPMVLLGTYSLLVLPNVIGLKGQTSDMRVTRIIKNMCIGLCCAIILSVFVLWLLEVISFYR